MDEKLQRQKNDAIIKAGNLENQAKKAFEDAGDLEIKSLVERLRENKLNALTLSKIISAFSCYEKAGVRKPYWKDVIKEFKRIESKLKTLDK